MKSSPYNLPINLTHTTIRFRGTLPRLHPSQADHVHLSPYHEPASYPPSSRRVEFDRSMQEVTSLEDVQARLQGHTEILMLVMSFADPSAIGSCLRASRRYHALAYRHIDVLYRHVFIDRNTIESVFQGILWDRLDTKWTVSRMRRFDTDEENDDDDDETSAYDEHSLGRRTSHTSSDTDSDVGLAAQSDEMPNISSHCSNSELRNFRRLGRRFVEDYVLLERQGEETIGGLTSEWSGEGDGPGMEQERVSPDCAANWELSGHWSTPGNSGHPEWEDPKEQNYDKLDEGDRTPGAVGESPAKLSWRRDGEAAMSSGCSAQIAEKEAREGSRRDSPLLKRKTDLVPDDDPLDRQAPTYVGLAADPTSASAQYHYRSDVDAQHRRKQHALAQCEVLTLSDRYPFPLSDLPHSHDILHNGKAHQLLPRAVTLRILPPTHISHGVEHLGLTETCGQGKHCRFIRELSPKKVVYRNLGDSCDEMEWDRCVGELVLFLPFAGWAHRRDAIADPEPSTAYGIARFRAKRAKIVFGPYVKKGTLAQVPLPEGDRDRDTSMYMELENVISMIRAATFCCETLTVYGLERVKVWRSDNDKDDLDHTGYEDLPSNRLRWWKRRHRKAAYGPQELADMVNDSLEPGHKSYQDSSFHGEIPRITGSVQLSTIEDYLATDPTDELFTCERDGEAIEVGARWLSSTYWIDKLIWQSSATIPELGEGDYHDSDTDEDHPRALSPFDYGTFDEHDGMTEEQISKYYDEEMEEAAKWNDRQPHSPEYHRWNRRYDYYQDDRY